MNGVKCNNEASIYIIDDNYRIVHCNSALQEKFPQLQCGDYCYERLCQEAGPCKGCPLSGKDGSATVFYNRVLQRWLAVGTGKIHWPGTGSCTMFLVHEIDEGNKNLFYSLTSLSAYDELFELNFTRDSYKILCHVENKYVIPDTEGSLSRMLDQVSKHMIHPDDVRAFVGFWDGQRIRSLLEQEEGRDSMVLKGHFRKLRVDGSYGWVAQIAVPLNRRGGDEDILMCFIQDINEQKRREEEMRESLSCRNLERDELTGLYRRTVFFKKAQEFVLREQGSYCLVAVDIEHFKLFNEWYGREEGDRLLARVGVHIRDIRKEYGGIAGYMGRDDFAILLPNKAEAIGQLQKRIIEYVKQCGKTAGFLPAFGIFRIEDRNLEVTTMYDRACIALVSVKGSYAQRACWYDSGMMRQMEENHKLLSQVQRGLDQGEFIFYVQPKCNMRTGRIVGLEALVRWNHPRRGMIPPGEFLPVLESNGLITKLDFYLWEEVCRKLRLWIDQGYQVVPISVNVSRMDIYVVDVVSVFRQLVEKYSLNPRLLEVEITESAYVEEFNVITGVVEALREAGFTVLMDDFGSGYSSLNMLKDVKVDVLKIDMKFLDMDGSTIGKGVEILEAITRLANIMGMRMIAEGIETEEQIEFLMNIGCAYGQGYYFFRPMPAESFVPILADGRNIDYRGIRAKQMDRISLKDLFAEDIASDTVMNNILGAVAFYELWDGKLELVRVNEQYCALTGTNMVDLETQRSFILQDTREEDRPRVLGIFTKAYENPMKGAEGDIRRRKADGTYMWMHLRVFFLREQDGCRLFYGAASDVTEQKQREQKLEASQWALSAVMHISEKDRSFMKLSEKNRRAAAAIFAQVTQGGMIGCYCEEGYPLYFASHEIIRLMGYDSFEELSEAISGLAIHTIHPQDRARVRRDLGPEYYPGLEYTTTYRMQKKDGTWIWILDKGRVVEAEDGRLAIVSACTDISETVEARQNLATDLEVKRQEIDLLAQKQTSILHLAGINSWEWDLKEDRLYLTNVTSPSFQKYFCQKGETTNDILPKLTGIFDEDISIVKEYRQPFVDYMMYLKENVSGGPLFFEFPVRSEDGNHIWFRSAGQTLVDGEKTPIAVVGYCTDITENRLQKQMLTQLASTDPLTGLLNRQSAIPSIRAYLNQGNWISAAMIMFDMDNFKQANDVFGHDFGDTMIVQNARKLKSYFRSEDIVCRIGGDEFIILCKNISEKDIEAKLTRIVEEMSTTRRSEGRDITFSLSAGYVMIPEQGISFDELYHKADIALFAAKLCGKCAFKKYSASMKAIRIELAQ